MSVWFVDGLNGNDSNAGTSFAQAFKTIAKAISAAGASDTILACATTTYSETSTLNYAQSVTLSGANASGVVDGTKASITTATNALNLFTEVNGSGNRVLSLSYLTLSSTASSPGACIYRGVTWPYTDFLLEYCTVNGFSTLLGNSTTNDNLTLYATEVAHCTSFAVGFNLRGLTLDRCSIHDNAAFGIGCYGADQAVIRRSLIYGNAGAGINLDGGGIWLAESTIAFNGADGFTAAAAGGIGSAGVYLVDTVFYGNSGYGFNAVTSPTSVFNANNAYGGNSSGARNGLPAGTGDLSLSSSPFVSSTNMMPSGTGAALIPSFPGSTLPDGTPNYRCIGAVQPQNTAAPSTPNTPALTITDNGDGTGATATISGSSAGSVNTVEVISRVSNGALVQTAFGPRTGDGTVAISLANGAYAATVTSSLNGIYAAPCDPYGFTTSSGGSSYNSPHAALAHSVQATIQALIADEKLSGVVADSVRVRKVPSAVDFSGDNPLPAGKHAYPGILIVYGDRERDLAGINDRDDIGFPVTIVFAAKDVDASGRNDLEDNDDTYLTWRKVISDVFRNQPFSVTNYAPINPLVFQTCQIEYGPIVDWSRWQKDQIFVGSFTLVFVLRKFRGLNPAN